MSAKVLGRIDTTTLKQRQERARDQRIQAANKRRANKAHAAFHGRTGDK